MNPLFRHLVVGASAGVALGMAACGSLAPAGSRTAILPRGMLSAVPCMSDAIRSTFGTLPSSESSHMQAEHTGQPHLKQQLRVMLDPSESGKSAGQARLLVYDLSHRGSDAVLVRYWVDLRGALGEEFMEQAFLPLEQCGAVR